MILRKAVCLLLLMFILFVWFALCLSDMGRLRSYMDRERRSARIGHHCN